MEEKIIAVANKYKSLYFLDAEFKNFPDEIKNELKIAMVLTCEKCGAIVKLYLDENLDIRVDILKEDDDYDFDEIAAKYALRSFEKEKAELLAKFQLYYKVKTGKLNVEDIK